MKISFPCPGCGKALKARPDAAGRTRKCPVCATPVRCPEPVVTAELVASPGRGGPTRLPTARPVPTARPAPGLFDDDNPYDVAPETRPGLPPGPKKPCPICGETIPASASTCHYCGESLDSGEKKPKKKKKKRKTSKGAPAGTKAFGNLGLGLVLLVLGIGATVTSYNKAVAAGGGTWTLWWGPMLWGTIHFFSGLYYLITGE